MKTLYVISLLTLLIHISIPVDAQNPPPGGHRIELITELVQNATAATWKDQSGADLNFNQRGNGRPSVLHGFKEGLARVVNLPNLPTPLDQLSPQERAQALAQYQSSQPIRVPSLDIEFDNQGNQDQAVRGVYQITLPADMKRIQLEVDYDILLVNENQESDSEFFVEVNERSSRNPNQWEKTGEVKNYKIERARQRGERLQKPVLEISNQLYQSHMYNANISEWRGKEIQLVLTATAPGNASRRSNGRWLQARLVGATFDYKIGP